VTDQYARFLAVSASVRPLRLVSLHGSWRGDRRELTNAPAVDADRLELGADLMVGAFVVRGVWYDTTERALAGQERSHQGFYVTLARRFAGWLPVVTEAFSRGHVR
jgi:hypothetical protein